MKDIEFHFSEFNQTSFISASSTWRSLLLLCLDKLGGTFLAQALNLGWEQNIGLENPLPDFYKRGLQLIQSFMQSFCRDLLPVGKINHR